MKGPFWLYGSQFIFHVLNSGCEKVLNCLVSLILSHAAATAKVNVRAPGVVGADAAQGDMGLDVPMIVSGVLGLGARIHL